MLVGRTLVDASQWSASVSEMVVLPSFSCVGELLPVAAVSVARSVVTLFGVDQTLPAHLEDIVAEGRARLRTILHQYANVFPAPGEPVTGRTMAVRHDIDTQGARPVRCGPCRLAPAGLRTEQTCIREMLEGGHIEPNDSPWASPVVLVTKKMSVPGYVLTTAD